MESRSRSKVAAAASVPNHSNKAPYVLLHGWQYQTDVATKSYRLYNIQSPLGNNNFTLIEILSDIMKDDESKINKKLLATLIDYFNCRESMSDNQKQQFQRIKEQHPLISDVVILLFKRSNLKTTLFLSTKENIIKYFNIVLPEYLKIMLWKKNLSLSTEQFLSDMIYDDKVVNYILQKYYDNEIFSNSSINVGTLDNFGEPVGFNGQPYGLETKPIPSGGSRRRLSKHKKTKKAKKHLKKSR